MPPAPPTLEPPTYRRVVRLAYPVVFSQLAATLMGLTDILFMGWVSTDAQAGVGLGGIVCWTFGALFIGTLTVINTFVAQHVGAGTQDRCGGVVWSGLLLAIVFSALIELTAPQVARLVRVFGPDPTVAAVATTFAVIRVVGLPLALLETCLTSFLRGIGDTRTPMKVSFGMVALNVPLNFWLVFGGLGVPPLGPAGSAYATVAANGAGVVVLFLLLLRRHARRVYRTTSLADVERRTLASLLWVGLPIGVGWALEMVTWTIFTGFVSGLGARPLAAHNIVLQMIHLSFMPGVALSVAATTLVGQHIGGGDAAGASRAGYNALKLAIAYMGMMGLIFLVGGGLIATGFNRDPQVVRVARRLFVWAAAFQMFDATGMVSGGILRGAGDTRYPMVASVLCAWLVFVPLIWLLGRRLGWGVDGSWAGATIYIIVVGLVLFARVRSGRWKSYSVTERVEPAATSPRP